MHQVRDHTSPPPTEHQTLIQKADGIALSRYIRNILFYNFKPITIQIFTEDIALLSATVSGYIREFRGFVAGLAIREQLFQERLGILAAGCATQNVFHCASLQSARGHISVGAWASTEI